MYPYMIAVPLPSGEHRAYRFTNARNEPGLRLHGLLQHILNMYRNEHKKTRFVTSEEATVVSNLIEELGMIFNILNDLVRLHGMLNCADVESVHFGGVCTSIVQVLNDFFTTHNSGIGLKANASFITYLTLHHVYCPPRRAQGRCGLRSACAPGAPAKDRFSASLLLQSREIFQETRRWVVSGSEEDHRRRISAEELDFYYWRRVEALA
ncbi:hypothetical protein BJ165DRAFT_1409947 [Panaeolus papilionaceus]|nr:hypothetical protein BJ165DRAFT_1409947 [Panaeolus papilionaceus]